MKIALILAALLLAGCTDKVKSTYTTATKGYVMRCIDGTAYVVLYNDTGVAITPHVGVDGRPKACEGQQ